MAFGTVTELPKSRLCNLFLKPVKAVENFMLQAGPCNAMGVWILDRPGNLRQHLFEIEKAAMKNDSFTGVLKKIVTWHFWKYPETSNPDWFADHITVLEDPNVKTLDDFARLLGKVRQTWFDESKPRWRAILLNPDTGKNGAARNATGKSKAMHAFILYFDHAIGDGIRIERFVRDMSTAGKPPADFIDIKNRCRFFTRDAFDKLPDETRIQPSRLGVVSLPKQTIRKARPKQKSSTQFIVDVAADNLAVEKFYDPASKRTYRALITTALKTSEIMRQGNYFRATEFDAVPAKLRGKVPKPTTGRNSTWRQIIGSPLPGFILRRILGFWYRQFDIMLNVIPAATREFDLGGGKVVSGYGVPPILHDIPLTMDLITAFNKYHFTLLPGESCKVDVSEVLKSFAKGMGDSPKTQMAAVPAKRRQVSA